MKIKITKISTMAKTALIAVLSLCSSAVFSAEAPPPLPMGFFVTSVGVGDGANLGGIAGADAHCQKLASNVGSGDRTWRAYLSTQANGSTPAINAIERIGDGPWGNAKGIQIASDIKNLMYDNSNINHAHALNEKGGNVPSRVFGAEQSEHDVLTGTQLNGLAFAAGEDRTCSNWTSNSDDGKAHVGHADRHRGSTPGSGWNSSHDSRGCSQTALISSGGAGLFYCFAAD